MVCNIYEKWCVPFSFLCYTKHSVDLKGETNNMERRNAWKIYTADQLKELDQINSRYKVCLDEGKTERECVRLTVKEIEKKGYRNLKDIKGSLKAGDKVYAVCMGKSIAAFQIGKEPLENGMNIQELNRILIPIDGLPPVPSQRPEYCPFYARCEYRCDRCLKHTDATMKEVRPGHYSACCLTQEELAEGEERLRHKDYGASPERRPSSENCLAVEDVRKYFPVYKGIMKRKVGEVKAIEDISFTIKRGETLGVVGESGCGKTTLARCIMRMYEPDEGRIIFEGKDVAHASDKELKPYRPKVSMIFQDPFSSLDPRQNAGSIVGESLKIHHLVKDHAEYEKRVDELFRKVGLDPALKERVAHEFSGGQRQRIGIARALSSNPSLIICDEPISALDVSIQAQIINLLEQIQAEMGISYIFIAHDLAVVKHISDRILVMYLGRVMEIAPCEELYEHSLHPYTQALLSAIPVADPEIEENREVTTVQGEVPSILKRPSGCPFHNRCPQCTERCKQETPQLHEAFPGHFVACHLYGQE